jgi:hypothetical protein
MLATAARHGDLGEVSMTLGRSGEAALLTNRALFVGQQAKAPVPIRMTARSSAARRRRSR